MILLSGLIFAKDEIIFFTQVMPIETPSTNYPVAPNNYGYWAYDNTDIGFPATPEFNWVELDPQFGGENGVHHQLDDDDA